LHNKRIAMLHYAGPPGVGGVEATIAYHARGLADLGYAVRVISGSGGAFDPRVDHQQHPLFGSIHPDVLNVKKQLDAGTVSADFEALVDQQIGALMTLLDGCDTCIVHNIHTLNKNLPLTAALRRLTESMPIRWLAWAHDLAWTNEQYLPELRPGHPWDLLRQPWPNTIYVTVSEPRRAELAALFDLPPESIQVVFPGVDPARFFRWTDTTRRIVDQLGLLDADGILLLPARLTRRKNIAAALWTLAAIRQQAAQVPAREPDGITPIASQVAGDFRLIVTGPPGPHNPANPGYLGELLDLRRQLGLEGAAHFLYELDDPPLIPDDDTLADLYLLADGLFFPSTQEGFGIPMLEAGLARLPAYAADIPPLRATGQTQALYFDPVGSPPDAIAGRVLAHLSANAAYQFRLRVRKHYRWDAIIRDQIMPLIEGR
jgi:glycosyltransferase involved in cell wall biosynthesis